MINVDPNEVQLFIDALRAGDKASAMRLGQAITSSPDAVNFGVAPGEGYNDEVLANLIEENLKGVQQGRVNLIWSCYLPVIVGAVVDWVAQETHRVDDGKISSESEQQSTPSDPSGS